MRSWLGWSEAVCLARSIQSLEHSAHGALASPSPSLRQEKRTRFGSDRIGLLRDDRHALVWICHHRTHRTTLLAGDDVPFGSLLSHPALDAMLANGEALSHFSARTVTFLDRTDNFRSQVHGLRLHV